MGTSIAKVMKEATSAVALYQQSQQRAWDIYMATVKRAEADFFERIKKANAIFQPAGAEEEGGTEPAQTNSQSEQPTVAA